MPILRTLKGKPGLENRGDEERPIELDGFASCVAREKDACFPLRDVVHVQNLFSVIAERLGGNGVQAIEAEEGRDEEDGEKKDKPIRYTDFTDFFQKNPCFSSNLRNPCQLFPRQKARTKNALPASQRKRIQEGEFVVPEKIKRCGEKRKRCK